MVWAVVCSLAILSAGCGLFEAMAAPAAPTPTVAPMPILTLLPPTSAAEPSPSLEGAALPPLSPLALALEDLPPGFVRVDPQAYGFHKEALTFQQFSADEVCAYAHPEGKQMVAGILVGLDSWVEQLAWQAAEANPQALAEVLLSQVGVQTGSPQPLAGLNGIGENVGGFGLTVQGMGQPARAEAVVFHRKGAGALLVSLWPEGQPPIVPTAELGRRWDGRIQSAPQH